MEEGMSQNERISGVVDLVNASSCNKPKIRVAILCLLPPLMGSVRFKYLPLRVKAATDGLHSSKAPCLQNEFAAREVGYGRSAEITLQLKTQCEQTRLRVIFEG
jgi:hypothetical protein